MFTFNQQSAEFDKEHKEIVDCLLALEKEHFESILQGFQAKLSNNKELEAETGDKLVKLEESINDLVRELKYKQ